MVYINNIQNLVDFDDLFIVNPITREINTETKKLCLMQHDHNSEIIRFQVPRVIEGYDIAQCNRVEIHYTNINSRTKEENSNIYAVSNIVVDEDCINFSWIVSSDATKYPGLLHFVVRFAFLEEDGTFSYIWSTSTFKDIRILESMNNTEVVVQNNSDIFSRIDAEVMRLQNFIGGIENGSY